MTSENSGASVLGFPTEPYRANLQGKEYASRVARYMWTLQAEADPERAECLVDELMRRALAGDVSAAHAMIRLAVEKAVLEFAQ